MTKKTWDEAEKSKEAKGMMGGFFPSTSRRAAGGSRGERTRLCSAGCSVEEKRKKKTRQDERVEEEKKEHKEEENREKWQTTNNLLA